MTDSESFMTGCVIWNSEGSDSGRGCGCGLAAMKQIKTAAWGQTLKD